eukprot:UN21143
MLYSIMHHSTKPFSGNMWSHVLLILSKYFLYVHDIPILSSSDISR